jgi:hypothetical protein
MDVYPFHHQNLFFNIITDSDLTFTEVRGILDYLLKEGAFQKEEANTEYGKFYDFQLDHIQYVADVYGYEVVIYRREESK